MTPKQIQILVNMDVCLTPDRVEFWPSDDTVFLRLVNYGSYVDSPVNGLYQEDDKWFVDTKNYHGLALSSLRPDQIQVCKVVQGWWKDDANLV